MMTRRNSENRRKSGSSSSRHHLLELNVRTASLKRQRRHKAEGMLWKVGATVVVLALLSAGLRLAAKKFFFQNTEYALHHLDAQLDGVITPEELVTVTGFDDGKNLFGLDLDQARRKLTALPEVRAVTLERILPDTIRVKIERRTPVFLFAGTGDAGESFISGKSFLCDRDGFLMQPARVDPEFLNLPVLRGVDLGNTLAGSRLENERLSFAIRLLEALSEIPEERFKIRLVDVSKEYAAVVTDESNARYTFGTNELPGQLERFRKLLAHCQEVGRKIETANLMTIRNTPVTFVLTPEHGGDKINPVTTSSHPPLKKNARR